MNGKSDSVDSNAGRDKRPLRSDPGVRSFAAEKLAEACAQWDGEVDWRAAIDRLHGSWGNGYEMARDLERYAHVSPDAELVEILDGGQWLIDDALGDATKAWVLLAQPVMLFHKGDRVTCRWGAGVVWEVKAEVAKYVVATDDRDWGKGGGYVMNAEDVSAEQVPA